MTTITLLAGDGGCVDWRGVLARASAVMRKLVVMSAEAEQGDD